MKSFCNWVSKHAGGISMLAAGLCIMSGARLLEEQAHGLAAIEFVLAGLNIWLYTTEINN